MLFGKLLKVILKGNKCFFHYSYRVGNTKDRFIGTEAEWAEKTTALHKGGKPVTVTGKIETRKHVHIFTHGARAAVRGDSVNPYFGVNGGPVDSELAKVWSDGYTAKLRDLEEKRKQMINSREPGYREPEIYQGPRKQ